MANPFDEVPYPGFPFPESHPDRLATIATLFGMTPPLLESCRILELGCGDGSNLIPMAFGLPQSQCLGVDLAERPIQKGRAMAEALGLTHLKLEQIDLCDITRAQGEFDYIIAHGVYSWVAPEVQEKVLAICGETLAANGVAYVSYNAYPGGHIRDMVRHMMLFETRHTSGAEERVHQGIEFVQRVVESRPEADPYRQLLECELKRMRRLSASSIYHDDFAAFNVPVYFHEFIERASRYGLQYLGEAEFPAMYAAHALNSDASTAFKEDCDLVAREQWVDFLLCRMFRRTLLCRKEMAVCRTPRSDRLRSLYVATQLQPVAPNPDLASVQAEEFRAPDGKMLSTNHPLAKAAITWLGAQWPRRVPFTELEAAAKTRVGGDCNQQTDDPTPLENLILRMYAGDLVELHVYAPRLALAPGERPLSSPLARYQLREGSIATNLHHQSVEIDQASRHLLRLADGTRDRAQLLRDLDVRIVTGEVTMEKDGQPVDNLEEARQILARGLEPNLDRMARLALLMDKTF
jgi:methyltransferase-like protein